MSVHFDDAKPDQCRLPLWALAERTGDVCGEPVKPGSSYCPECHRRLYDRPTRERVAQVEAFVAQTVGSGFRK